MSTEIKVPTLGESISEATLGQWLKQPGDAIATGVTSVHQGRLVL